MWNHVSPSAPVFQADTSIAMDTDSNADEEGGDESRDGQERPSPSHTHEDATVHCAPVRAVSAPCSPSGARPGPGCSPGSALDCASFQKAGERPNSLPPSSPRALAHNDWAYDSAVCPAERQHPGMQRDKGIHGATHRATCAQSTLISVYVQAYAQLCAGYERSRWELLNTCVIICGMLTVTTVM